MKTAPISTQTKPALVEPSPPKKPPHYWVKLVVENTELWALSAEVGSDGCVRAIKAVVERTGRGDQWTWMVRDESLGEFGGSAAGRHQAQRRAWFALEAVRRLRLRYA